MQNTDNTVDNHIKLFDYMDFEGFNKRNWQIVRDVYDENIVLKFSNGNEIRGIDNILKQMQTGLEPETKTISHPIHFGSGDWTAVVMVMTGRFTEPYTNPDGSITQPTGKLWIMEHCALVHWKNNKIIEVVAFWDNDVFLKQVGVC